MEKVVYSLTAEPGAGAAELAERLRGRTVDRLADLGARGIQLNVVDEAAAPADGLRIVTSPAPADALVSVWVDSANDRFRAPVDRALAEEAATLAAYLVTESVPLVPDPPAVPGERTHGFSQVAFLRRPEDLAVDAWLDIWLNSHTQIAIDTQDTFLYVQNVVTRVLTPGATPWDAIVEEGFPADAMTDSHAFFDARGDDERLAEHQRVMFESVQRFVDLARIEVIPTSRYVVGPLPA